MKTCFAREGSCDFWLNDGVLMVEGVYNCLITGDNDLQVVFIPEMVWKDLRRRRIWSTGFKLRFESFWTNLKARNSHFDAFLVQTYFINKTWSS